MSTASALPEFVAGDTDPFHNTLTPFVDKLTGNVINLTTWTVTFYYELDGSDSPQTGSAGVSSGDANGVAYYLPAVDEITTLGIYVARLEVEGQVGGTGPVRRHSTKPFRFRVVPKT